MLRNMAQSNWKLLLFATAVVLFTGSYGDLTYGDCNENVRKLATANTELGFKFYQLFRRGTSGNFCFSTFSISTALGILYTGTRGNTAKQLRSALGYDSVNLESSDVSSAFNQLIEQVISKNQSPNSDYTLNLASELLLAQFFDVYPEYKQQVQDFFHAYIKEVDFRSNPAQIVQDVNQWVSDQTHGKITQLLGGVSSAAVFVILDAIYFQGIWKTQFDKKDTKPGIFYNDGSDSKAKEVPLMHLTADFPYASTDELQAVELPYNGGNLSMIVLVPRKRDGLPSLEISLTLEQLLTMQKQMYTTSVAVTLPKFQIVYQRALNSDIQALGAKDVFIPLSADLTGITPDKGIYVNSVVHKAFVEVNEEGSEAAGATSIGGSAAGAVVPFEFLADHPFVFIILDKTYNVPLFVGRCTKL